MIVELFLWCSLRGERALSGYDSSPSSLSPSLSLSTRHVTLHVCNERGQGKAARFCSSKKPVHFLYNTIKINRSFKFPKTSKIGDCLSPDPSFSLKESNKKNQMSQKVWTTKPMSFDSMGFIKIKNVCYSKDGIKHWKDKSPSRRKCLQIV